MTTPYKINGSELSPQPSPGSRWGPRRALGLDGQNRTIYAPVRTFQIEWDALTFVEFQTILAFYQAVQSSGFVTVDLPTYGGGSYDSFTTYTNCTLDEPVPQTLDNKYQVRVVLMVRNILA